ncbi:MAG: hypothetical protein JXL97_17880 [Bacteroidales bacterium]|nr:hypothetical protein [Bacteroidales bacterium]
MEKLRVRENKKIGYYAFIFKRLGKPALINESFVFSTSFNSNRLSQGKIGEFAIFTADLLKDYDKAEKYFLQAIERDPENAFWIGNYAIFIHFYKKDFNLAEEYYQKSLKLYEDDAFLKFNYAQLVLFYKSDYDLVEKLMKEVLMLEPNNSKFKCSYAAFLFKVRKKFAQAEKLCEEVISKNDKNPSWFATYAQLKLLKGEQTEAKKLIDRAFELEPSDELSLELWFYLYAHYEENREEAEAKIIEHLSKGIKSFVWGLQQNVVVAIFSGHPESHKLEEYAKQIMGELLQKTDNFTE